MAVEGQVLCILRRKLIVCSSFGAQRLKHLPPMRETRVQSLGWEDPLEKEMVTHSSILAWRIPWTEEPGRLQSMESQRVGHEGVAMQVSGEECPNMKALKWGWA